MTSNPLVSIVIITYNSSKFVRETLESIKKQTYNNIELIISDDGSQDLTIDICEKWLLENKDLFKRTKLIKVEKNTGIPGNCNRGIEASKGMWIKLIAGDDILLPNALKDFIDTIQHNLNYKIVQTNGLVFNNSFSDDNNYKHTWSKHKKLNFFELNASQQYQALKYKFFLFAPGIFIHKDIFQRFKFDEEFKLIEDLPFYIYVTKNGYKIDYMNIITVGYRRHDESVQRVSSKPYPINFTINQTKKILRKYYKNYNLIYIIFHYNILLLFNQIGLNRNNKISKFLYLFIYRIHFFVLRVKFIIYKF